MGTQSPFQQHKSHYIYKKYSTVTANIIIFSETGIVYQEAGYRKVSVQTKYCTFQTVYL